VESCKMGRKIKGKVDLKQESNKFMNITDAKIK
jgi:hypothetical protein